MKNDYAIGIALVCASCAADKTGVGASPPVAPSQSSAVSSPSNEDMERTLIIGSAETPDPVLTKVRELEKAGIVKDVVVLESFPVQIRLSAPRKVIDELNAMPRVGGLR